jgi:Ca2+/H+ antiporter
MCRLVRPVYWLGLFIPVALVLRFADVSPSLIFVVSAIGVVPTAALMGEATEHLAARAGPGIGGSMWCLGSSSISLEPRPLRRAG